MSRLVAPTCRTGLRDFDPLRIPPAPETETLESCDDHRRLGLTATGPRYGRQGALAAAIADLWESCARVAREAHMPSREGMMAFFGNQVLVNAAAWTAGLASAALVRRFFEVRGIGNFWGLMAPGGRSVVSAGDYQVIMALASYGVGLAMLIVVRHYILRLIAEFRALRSERAGGAWAAVAGGVWDAPGAPPTQARRRRSIDGLELAVDELTVD